MHRFLLLISAFCICAECFVFTQRLPSSEITPRRLLFDEPFMWSATSQRESASGDATKGQLHKKASSSAGTKAIMDVLRNYWAPEQYAEQSANTRDEQPDSEQKPSPVRRYPEVTREAPPIQRGGAVGNFFPSPKFSSTWLWYANEKQVPKGTPRVG